GYVLTVDVADALGICDKTVRRWIEVYDLPATQLYKKRNDSKRRQYYISVDEFWKWAYEHKNLIVFSRVKRDALLPEPAWLDV
ncbi:helix-turn-helix domain-containing protein, partial [Bacillus thuringiensis]|nr:helix-turn-helix domain-containing protein [Bacillus thuringiensis]